MSDLAFIKGRFLGLTGEGDQRTAGGGPRECPPGRFFFLHLKVKCINLVHFEGKIKKRDL